MKQCRIDLRSQQQKDRQEVVELVLTVAVGVVVLAGWILFI